MGDAPSSIDRCPSIDRAFSPDHSIHLFLGRCQAGMYCAVGAEEFCPARQKLSPKFQADQSAAGSGSSTIWTPLMAARTPLLPRRPNKLCEPGTEERVREESERPGRSSRLAKDYFTGNRNAMLHECAARPSIHSGKRALRAADSFFCIRILLVLARAASEEFDRFLVSQKRGKSKPAEFQTFAASKKARPV